MEDRRMVHNLIKKLIEKTEQGRIEWSHEENAVGPWAQTTRPSTSSFTLSLTRGTVSVWSVDGDDLHPFIFEVRGDRGQVVEAVETQRLNGNDPRDFSSMEKDVKTLYEAARRNALNIDSVLNQMLEDLEGK
ncbi:hypothetical protein ACIQVN_10710 [Streptomyces cyaneofuscatus]|uniref:hypothetical protein n=1 Tax=Streptomyces cyaneofuscatus TaxID=66883 RepID=UPI0037F87490